MAAKQRGTRRSIGKKAKAFEREVAEAYSGVRLGGPGEIDVVSYGPDGLELLAIECHESQTAKLSKLLTEKLAQAARLAAPRRGAPVPTLVFRLVAGQGQATERYVLRRRDDDVRLLERTGAFGE